MERQVNDDSDPRRVGETLAMMWIFVLFNYVYADIGTVFVIFTRPELLERLQSGRFGSFHLTEGFILAGAVLMEICIAMIPLSWKLPRKANRVANIAAGALFTAVITMTLLASGKVPPLNFYTFFQIVEICSTAAIVAIAWRWRSAAAAARPRRIAA
jgi:hypothetical protein